MTERDRWNMAAAEAGFVIVSFTRTVDGFVTATGTDGRRFDLVRSSDLRFTERRG